MGYTLLAPTGDGLSRTHAVCAVPTEFGVRIALTTCATPAREQGEPLVETGLEFVESEHAVHATLGRSDHDEVDLHVVVDEDVYPSETEIVASCCDELGVGPMTYAE